MYQDYQKFLFPFYDHFLHRLCINPQYTQHKVICNTNNTIKNKKLREILESDAAMAAILPEIKIHYTLGSIEFAPFFLFSSDTILLSSTLLPDTQALCAAARWGFEAANIKKRTSISLTEVRHVLWHAYCLISLLPKHSRKSILSQCPQSIALEFLKADFNRPKSNLLEWQADIMHIEVKNRAKNEQIIITELASPVECILISGGDSRLLLDEETKQNKRGIPPRPQPEAIHFSSSTASAITDHGFLFCDLIRRDLLRALSVDGISDSLLHKKMVDGVAAQIGELFGLEKDEVDVAITPSGTDSELLVVMVSLARAGKNALTNILIAPEECGKGTVLAGGGCYFDDSSATGAPIAKGTRAWSEKDIRIQKIAIRDGQGVTRSLAEIDLDVMTAGKVALSEGRHVLVHLLHTSKTGIFAPSVEAIAALVALAPERVHVAVDACQTRGHFKEIGCYVRRGWMVQVTGSKFLTGPPFSGALLLPPDLRDQAKRVGNALLRAPGVGHAADWVSAWSDQMPHGTLKPSFGPLFRWLPALLEAKFLEKLPQDCIQRSFTRFRDALIRRMEASPYLKCMPNTRENAEEDSSRLTIMSFQVFIKNKAGTFEALEGECCQRLFTMLNQDISGRFPGASQADNALARLQAYVGQPVTIHKDQGTMTVLRLVLGARFFNIVGHAGPDAEDAALRGEIDDALRAIDKI